MRCAVMEYFPFTGFHLIVVYKRQKINGHDSVSYSFCVLGDEISFSSGILFFGIPELVLKFHGGMLRILRTLRLKGFDLVSWGRLWMMN